MQRTGFIGLGAMGAPMAKRMVSTARALTVAAIMRKIEDP